MYINIMYTAHRDNFIYTVGTLQNNQIKQMIKYKYKSGTINNEAKWLKVKVKLSQSHIHRCVFSLHYMQHNRYICYSFGTISYSR